MLSRRREAAYVFSGPPSRTGHADGDTQLNVFFPQIEDTCFSMSLFGEGSSEVPSHHKGLDGTAWWPVTWLLSSLPAWPKHGSEGGVAFMQEA